MNNPKKVATLKLSNYGISKWSPGESSLIEHLSAIKIPLDAAAQQGLSQEELCSLVLLSLPEKYTYLNNILKPEDKRDLRSLFRKVLEGLGAGQVELTRALYNLNRRTGESLLSFLSRLVEIWTLAHPAEQDPNARSRFLMHKLLQHAAPAQKTEIQRALSQKQHHEIAIEDLQNAIIHAMRLAPDEAEFPDIHDSNNLPGIFSIKDNEVQSNLIPVNNEETSRRPLRDLSKIKCYSCSRFGHFARRCPERPTRGGVRRTRVAFRSSSPKEKRDHGREATRQT